MMYNITKMDMANVGAGLGFVDAVEQKVEGVLEGFGIVDTEEIPISVVKVNGQIFSGASKVVEGRLRNLSAIVGDSDDVEKKKISVKFESIKLAKGNGTNIIITRYED